MAMLQWALQASTWGIYPLPSTPLGWAKLHILIIARAEINPYTFLCQIHRPNSENITKAAILKAQIDMLRIAH